MKEIVLTVLNRPSSKVSTQAEELYVSGVLPAPRQALAWLALFVAMLFFSAFLYASLLGAYIAVAHPEVVQSDALFDMTISQLMWSPAGLAWSTTLDFILLVPFILWASNFRNQSWWATLALRRVPWRVFWFWMLLYCGFVLTQLLLSFVVQMDSGELFDALSGSRHLGVFLAFVFLGPIIEELIFRGYLFQAWRNTRLGQSGTLLVTSVLFTAIHSYQYPFITLISIFALSLLLGLAREKTGSLWMPIILHALNNALAMTLLLYFDG